MQHMKTLIRFLVIGLLSVSAALARDPIERVVQKSFAVQPGGLLKVETQGGDITVTPGSGNEVVVVARQKIRAKNDAEADELLQKLQLEISQSGNDVTATAKYEKRPSGLKFRLWPPVQVSFEITVPARFDTQLGTSGGDVVIGDVTGAMRVGTSGGDVKIGRIDGTVQASTSGGDIELRESSGAARLDTSGGDIAVGRVVGATKITTSGGDIDADTVEGSLNAHTSGGDVKARIKGALADDCSLSTSGGDVEVTLDQSAAFQLDAATSGGDVDAAGLAITIERGGVGNSRLVGAVNGGGPKLKLRTSGGDIEIRAR
jgi:hypothetical protein